MRTRITAVCSYYVVSFFFQAECGIRDVAVTGVQTCALPICSRHVPARGEEEEHGESGEEEDERTQRAEVAHQEVQEELADDAAGRDDVAPEGERLEDEGQEGADDEESQGEGAQ